MIKKLKCKQFEVIFRLVKKLDLVGVSLYEPSAEVIKVRCFFKFEKLDIILDIVREEIVLLEGVGFEVNYTFSENEIVINIL